MNVMSLAVGLGLVVHSMARPYLVGRIVSELATPGVGRDDSSISIV